MPNSSGHPPDEDAELQHSIAAVLESLAATPSHTIVVYEEALKSASSPIVVARLRDRFGPAIHLLTAAREIDGGSWSPFLERYVGARRTDQRRMLIVVVDHLIALGVADGEHEREVLDRLGKAFPILVLEGTAEQRFCCNLGIGLAGSMLPSVIIQSVVRPLVRALVDVLRVGAPRTAILAVEATGALLKLLPDPKSQFPPYVVSAAISERDSPASVAYLREADHDRRMAFAIAGDPQACAQYFNALHRPLEETIAGQSEDIVETEILKRVELLRVLPAIIRQNSGRWE
jgi:hypothetical protein